MDDLASLELLSLVSKITTELKNHLGMGDKILSEFVIAQHAKCHSLGEFDSRMADMGVKFPQTLLESIDRLIRTMHPEHKGTRQTSNGEKEQGNGLHVDKKRNYTPSNYAPSSIDAHYLSDERSIYGGGQRKRSRISSSRDVSYEKSNDLKVRSGTVPKMTVSNARLHGGHLRGREDDVTYERPPDGARTKKRLTSPERFELQQMIKSGVLSASDYPDINEEYNATLDGGEFEEEEDIDIEIREEEPRFLAGHHKEALSLSPIRVVRLPDGSMSKSALTGNTLAKERRDLRQQQSEEKAVEQATQIDLNAQWNDPMAPDQRRFASDIRSQASKAPDSIPAWKRATQDKNRTPVKRGDMSLADQRKSLPVYAFRDQLLSAVASHQLLVVVGETGSGKTTQLPAYLCEAGYAKDGIIGCTQPRRVAATSVAKRVAQEYGCQLGDEVGYSIRFDQVTSPHTKIKYMTDGMLLHEAVTDPDLSAYKVLMLDEAHERTINTDVLFGLLKKTLKRRKDLKVIITSATLEADKFSDYFEGCPIFSIPGRTFPVEILFAKTPEEDYLDAALVTVLSIHINEGPGDILLFLTGQEEIDTSCEILHERMHALGPRMPELLILPVYAQLPADQQTRIFEPAPPGGRKVIIATNIAETSLTIDGVFYVIDPGFCKQSVWDPKLGMDSLVVTPISQAQAAQRAGRAGRTGPGKCYRLYTELAHNSELMPNSVPEIQRQNITHTILTLKCLGIDDLIHFDFMSPPPPATLLSGLEELYTLGCLDEEGMLTRLGRRMADFPMTPALAKVLLSSVEHECSEEALTIVAMLSVSTPWFRPRDRQAKADQKKQKFHDPSGDHLTLLNVYNGWKQSHYSTPFCSENFIHASVMLRAKAERQQLATIMERQRHRIISCGRDTIRVRKALCAGFFRNTARRDPQEGNWKTLSEQTPVSMHPSSALFGKNAEIVFYFTLRLTSKEYMHDVSVCEAIWLAEAAPRFFQVAPTDRLSKRKKAERIQPLHNRFAGEDDWRLSTQKRAGRGGGGGTWG